MSGKNSTDGSGVNEGGLPLFSLFHEAKANKCSIVKVGQISEGVDLSIGRPVTYIHGVVSAENYVDCSGLSLAYPYLYIQVKRLNKSVATFHIEIATEDEVSMRISLSTLYSKNPKSLDRILRLPFPMLDSWMIIAMNLKSIVKNYSQRTFFNIKSIQVCSNVAIRDIVTTSSPISPNIQELPSELDVKFDSEPLIWVDYANFDVSNPEASCINLGSRTFITERKEFTPISSPSKASVLSPDVKELFPSPSKKSPSSKSNKSLTMADLKTGPSKPGSAGKKLASPPHSDRSLSLLTPSKTEKSPVKKSSVKKEHLNVLSLERVLFYDGKQAVYVCSGKIAVFICGKLLVLVDIEHRAETELLKKSQHNIWKSFLKNEIIQNKLNSVKNRNEKANSDGISTKISFDTEGYRQVFWEAHSNPISFMEKSSDDKYLLSCESGQDAECILWDLELGKAVASFHPHSSSIVCAAFNRDSSAIVTVGLETQHHSQVITIWDVASVIAGAGTEAAIAKQLSDFHISKISFSPFDDISLLSCGRENIRFWRISKGHLPGKPVTLNEYSRGFVFTDIDFVSTVTASSVKGDRMRLALIASNKGLVFKVDCDRGVLVSAFQLHESAVHSLRVFSNGVITGSQDKSLRIWPFDFSDLILEAFFEGDVSSLCVDESSNRSTILVGTTSGTLGTLEIASHKYSTLLRSHGKTIHHVKFRSNPGVLSSQDANEFVTVSNDHTIRIWDGLSGLQKYEFTSFNDEPKCAALHNSQKEIVVGFQSGFIRVFDILSTSTIIERKFHKTTVSEIMYIEMNSYHSANNVSTSASGDSKKNGKKTIMSPISDGDTKRSIMLVSMALDGSIVIYDVNRNYSAVKMLEFGGMNALCTSARMTFCSELSLLAICFDSLNSLVIMETCSRSTWKVVSCGGKLTNIALDMSTTCNSLPSESMAKKKNDFGELFDDQDIGNSESVECVQSNMNTNNSSNDSGKAFIVSLEHFDNKEKSSAIDLFSSNHITGLNFRLNSGESNELLVITESDILSIGLEKLWGNGNLNSASSRKSLFDNIAFRRLNVGNIRYSQYFEDQGLVAVSSVFESSHIPIERRISKLYRPLVSEENKVENRLSLFALPIRTKKQSQLNISGPEYHNDNYANIGQFAFSNSTKSKLITCDENGYLMIYNVCSQHIGTLSSLGELTSPIKSHHELFEPIRMDIDSSQVEEVSVESQSDIALVDESCPISEIVHSQSEIELSEQQPQPQILSISPIKATPLPDELKPVTPKKTEEEEEGPSVTCEITNNTSIEADNLTANMNQEIESMLKVRPQPTLATEFLNVFEVKSTLHNNPSHWNALASSLSVKEEPKLQQSTTCFNLCQNIATDPIYLSGKRRLLTANDSSVFLTSMHSSQPDIVLTLPSDQVQSNDNISKVLSLACNDREDLIAVLTAKEGSNLKASDKSKGKSSNGSSPSYELLVYHIFPSGQTECLGGVQLQSSNSGKTNAVKPFAHVQFHSSEHENNESLLVFVPLKYNVSDPSNLKSTSLHAMIADIPVQPIYAMKEAILEKAKAKEIPALPEILFDYFSVVNIPYDNVTGVKILPNYHNIYLKSSHASSKRKSQESEKQSSGLGLVIYNDQNLSVFHGTSNHVEKSSSSIHVSLNGKHFSRVWYENLGPGVSLSSASTIAINGGSLCIALGRGGSCQGGKLWGLWAAPDGSCRDLQTSQPLSAALGVPKWVKIIDKKVWCPNPSKPTNVADPEQSKESESEFVPRTSSRSSRNTSTLIISNKGYSVPDTKVVGSETEETAPSSGLLCVASNQGLQLLAVSVHKLPLLHKLHKERVWGTPLSSGDRWQLVTHNLTSIQSSVCSYVTPLSLNHGLGFFVVDQHGQLGFYSQDASDGLENKRKENLSKLFTSSTKFTFKKLRTNLKCQSVTIVDVCSLPSATVVLFDREIVVYFNWNTEFISYSFQTQLLPLEQFTCITAHERMLLIGTNKGRTIVLNVRVADDGHHTYVHNRNNINNMNDFIENSRILHNPSLNWSVSVPPSPTKGATPVKRSVSTTVSPSLGSVVSPSVSKIHMSSFQIDDTQYSVMIIHFNDLSFAIYNMFDLEIEFANGKTEKVFEFAFQSSLLLHSNLSHTTNRLHFHCTHDGNFHGVAWNIHELHVLTINKNFFAYAQSNQSVDIGNANKSTDLAKCALTFENHQVTKLNVKYDVHSSIFDESNPNNKIVSVRMIRDGNYITFFIIVRSFKGDYLCFSFASHMSSLIQNKSSIAEESSEMCNIHFAKLLCKCNGAISKVEYIGSKVSIFCNNSTLIVFDLFEFISEQGKKQGAYESLSNVSAIEKLATRQFRLDQLTVTHGFSAPMIVYLNCLTSETANKNSLVSDDEEDVDEVGSDEATINEDDSTQDSASKKAPKVVIQEKEEFECFLMKQQPFTCIKLNFSL